MTEPLKLPEHLPRDAFQALIENAFDVFLILERDGRIKYASPSIRYVLGYKQSERVGRSGLELIHPDDRQRAGELLADIVGRPEGREYTQLRLKHKDGSWRTVEVMAQNQLDDPVIAGIIVNYRDITERIKAIEALRVSELRFNKAFAASPDAITINYIGSGRYLEVNPAFERMSGFSADEVIGRTSDDIGLWKEPETKTVIVEALQKVGHVRDLEAQFMTKDGEEKTCVVSAERIELAGEPCMLAVTRDVTLQKAAATELKTAVHQFRSDHRELIEKSVALKQILQHLDEERASYRHNIASNAKDLLAPIIAKLRETGGHLPPAYIERLEDAMDRIVGEDIEAHAHNMSKLTGRELEICELIRNGLSSKEIAAKLSLSPQTVHKHRRTIRRKLQLDNKGINLAAYLRSH